MRIDRFFINAPIEGGRVHIADDNLFHQWKHVFRYQVGTQTIIFNGDGYEYTAVIEELGNREATCAILQKKKALLPEKDLWLFMSLIKKDKFELTIQKSTELGVNHIVPLETEFSNERRIDIKRFQKILTEASEQCGRGNVPVLHDIMSFTDALSFVSEENITPYIAHQGGEEGIVNAPIKTALFIGPEGGFSPDELHICKEKAYGTLSLGQFILRAETAAIVGLSKLI